MWSDIVSACFSCCCSFKLSESPIDHHQQNQHQSMAPRSAQCTANLIRLKWQSSRVSLAAFFWHTSEETSIALFEFYCPQPTTHIVIDLPAAVHSFNSILFSLLFSLFARVGEVKSTERKGHDAFIHVFKRAGKQATSNEALLHY